MKNHNLNPGDVAVLGIPFDLNSSFLRGSARAPAAVRDVLYSGSANLCAESGLDLEASNRWEDLGDTSFDSELTAFDAIESSVSQLVSEDIRVLALGGDHSILFPIINATVPRYERLNILQLDAHPDLYDEMDGNRFSHACPVARIMEVHPDVRLIQIGIRTLTTHQREQAERFGVEIIEAAKWHGSSLPELDGPVYVSLDLDVLDPAFAPGVSHHEPGGLSTRDIISLINSIENPIIGADIVELNPDRDPAGITAAAAAKFLKEIVARMLRDIPE